MEAFNEVFIHLPEYQVVLCKQCMHGVIPGQIQGHLRRNHRDIQPSARQDIQGIFDQLPSIAKSPDEVVYPTPETVAIPWLPIYTDGYRCLGHNSEGQPCQFICHGKKIFRIEDHCKKAHNWQSNQRRGRTEGKQARQPSNRIWQDNQHCQRFFKTVAWQRYFQVRQETQAPVTQRGDQLLAHINRQRQWQAQEQTIQGEIPRSIANPWLEFTGWTIHLAGFTPEQLLAHIRPAEGEIGAEEARQHAVATEAAPYHLEEGQEAPGLAEACHATRRLIRQSFRVCRREVVGEPALEYVNRRECGADDNERPFYGEQQIKTVRKYSGHWVKILRYIWRTHSREERPAYALLDEQRAQLGHVQQAAVRVIESSEQPRVQAKARRQLVRQMLRFWLAMFDHPLKDDKFHSGIISGLAVLGIDGEHRGWVPAVNYTPVLAAIITTVRAMVVYYAHGIRQGAVQHRIQMGDTVVNARMAAPSVFKGVQPMVDRFMTLTKYGGQPMPLDRIFHQKTYGMKIRYTTKAPGQVLWEGEKITVGKAMFTVDQIRTVVHGLTEAVQQRLVHQLMWFAPDCQRVKGGWQPVHMPAMQIKDLYDDHSEFSPRWSFIQDHRNKWPEASQEWMWRRLFSTHASQFIEDTPSEAVQWKVQAVESYFRQVRQFKEELMVLVHMSGGAPARATELISVQHQNGQHSQGQRGVFIQDGMVAFVTQYHKGYSASKRVKIVHRFVPNEVGELVVYFLWLVQPFINQLQAAVNQQFEDGSFIWEPKPEEQWADEEVDNEAGEDGGGEEEPVPDEWSDDEDDEWLRDVPQAKYERPAINSDGFWDTDRVRRVMYRETEARVGVKIGVAVWRNAYPAIQRELSRDSNVKDMVDKIYGSGAPHSAITSILEQMQDVQARQSGHSQQMEEMIYGLLMSESPFTTMSEREQFRQVSVDWHRVLQFPSAFQEKGSRNDVKQHIKQEQDRIHAERQHRMEAVDVHAEFHRLYGAEAQFRGVQEAALQAIVARKPYVLVVMRTGGGKTMLFMLPAIGSPHGLTVVVVPVVSLRQDLRERCEQAGIRCVEWDGQRPPYDAQIVFITPESAVTMGFSRFLSTKQASGQLERIVIDECHTILESNQEWRPKVLELDQMVRYGVQVVYLTATLPPCEEPTFFQAIGVEGQDVHTIRDTTSRPNVSYSVRQYPREQEDEAVTELVERKIRQYREGQIIVYCKRVEQARHIADVLGCSVYHRQAGNVEQKRAILQRLTGEKERVFTATNALGLGVDAPRIRVVIHVGIREKIKQYGQESGRAGRDGQPSEAILLQSTWIDERTGQEKQEQGWRAEAAMKTFIKGEMCRRVPLDRHLDGNIERTACQVGEEKCDVCRGKPRGNKRRRIRVHTEEERRVQPRLEEGGEERARQHEEEAYKEREFRHGEEVEGRRRGEGEAHQKQEAKARQQERQKERQRQWIVQRRQNDTRVQAQVSVEQLDAILQHWKGRCSICVVHGEEQGHRSWRECPSPMHERVEKIWQAIRTVHFQAHSGCFWCKAPQAVCHQWENVSHSGPMRFKKRPGQECQFRGVMQDVIAAIVAVGEDIVMPWIQDEASKAGITPNKDGEEWDVCKEYLGHKVVMNHIEMSGLCRVLWEFGVSGL